MQTISTVDMRLGTDDVMRNIKMGQTPAVIVT